MLSEASMNAGFESYIATLEQAVKNSSDIDGLRRCFVSFGRWIGQNPPSKDVSVELFIDRYYKLLEFSLVKSHAAGEFLLCLGLLVLSQPNISAKRKADWSKKLSQSVFLSTCSEFLLYSLVYSFLQVGNVSSSTSFYNCMEYNIRLLSKLCNIVESASESSTVLNDILPLLLSLQNLTFLQQQAPPTVGLPTEGLCSLFSEFCRFLSTTLRFLRERHPKSLSDHQRLENGMGAVLHVLYRFFVDCILSYEDALFPIADKFVAFVLQLLDTCDMYGLWAGKKLGYQMIRMLCQHSMFQGQSADTLHFFTLIQCEVLHWYQQVVKICDEEGNQWDFMNDVMEQVLHRIDSKYQQSVDNQSLLWALETFQLYHQSILCTLERDQLVIVRRNELDRWLFTFCERVEQTSTLSFLKNTLSSFKRCLIHPTRRRTLPINSSMTDIVTSSKMEGIPDWGRTAKRTKRDELSDDLSKGTKKFWKVVYPSAQVDIVPVAELEICERSRISFRNEKDFVLQRSNHVEIPSSAVCADPAVDIQPKSDDTFEKVKDKDNQESISSYIDVDNIVNGIDLEMPNK
ncbi:hypothetical protein GpartN1_g2277.t1 [Galdieria partita]|uniref:Uncharacterized protein n=1 Tax=Galdieria partita TaxID=83374 RepID=A0A9C7PV36_9RHOD|nr:hypothetical protein GpartN1_g2277.t1 [Galdieria partita]